MYEQLSEWLAELEYLPRSTMKLERQTYRDPDDPDLVLDIEIVVPDAYNPSRLIPVKTRHNLGNEHYWAGFRDPKTVFLETIKHVILELACHESMEWLRVRETGRPLFDPHANQKEV